MFYPENSHFEREKRLIFLDGSIEGHISDLDEATNDLTSDFLDDRKSAMEEIREKKEELVKNIDTLTPDQKKRASEILERGKQTLESVAEQEEHKTDIEDLGTILNEIQQVDSTDDWKKEVELPSESEEKESTNPIMKIIEGVKKSALAGMILNSYISLLKWFKPKDREQISKLEDLHKEWFSVAELREAVGGFFEKKKIPLYLVEESEKDKDAYDKVYLEFIGARGVEIKDKSPEEVKLINKSFTLEKFVRETYLNDYKKHIDTGKDNVTTLTGIFEKRLPQKKDKGSFNKNKKSSFKMPDIFSFFGK